VEARSGSHGCPPLLPIRFVLQEFDGRVAIKPSSFSRPIVSSSWRLYWDSVSTCVICMPPSIGVIHPCSSPHSLIAGQRRVGDGCSPSPPTLTGDHQRGDGTDGVYMLRSIFQRPNTVPHLRTTMPTSLSASRGTNPTGTSLHLPVQTGQ